MVFADIAPDREFLLSFFIERMRRACNKEVRLYAVTVQLPYRILGRARLHLTDSPRDRQVRDDHKKHVVRILHLERARRLDKKRVLKIADRAAYLDDRNFAAVILCGRLHAVHDLVAHMWDRLDELPLIAERAFACDDRLVHHAACHVVVVREVAPKKTFVVPHILIGLEPAFEDEDFTVLGRVHRAGVDVQIRIDLHQIHRIALLLEQEADGARDHAFSHATHDPAEDEDIFVSLPGHTRRSGTYGQRALKRRRRARYPRRGV